MTSKEIECYEQACNYMEQDIQKELIKLGIEFKKEYSMSYESYFNHSKLNQPHFRIKNKHFKNSSIEINTNLYETDKMFRAILWKYDNHHHWLEKNCKTLNECKEFILNNLNYLGIIKHGYEQLTLF